MAHETNEFLDVAETVREIAKRDREIERCRAVMKQAVEAFGMLIIDTQGNVSIGPYGVELQTKALTALREALKEG